MVDPEIEKMDVGESNTFTAEHEGVKYETVVFKVEKEQYKVFVKVLEFNNELGTAQKLNSQVLDTFIDELGKSFGVDVR